MIETNEKTNMLKLERIIPFLLPNPPLETPSSQSLAFEEHEASTLRREFPGPQHPTVYGKKVVDTYA
jgi:hypothetical protein